MPETFTKTGTDLAAEVKAQFGDVGNVQINDTLILRWINNGAYEITASNPWNEKSLDTNLIADQALYDLNTILGSSKVQNYSSIVIDNRPIQVIPFAEYLAKISGETVEQNAERTPRLGTEYGGKLTLWPAPSQSVVSGMTIYFTAWPSAIATLAGPLPVPDRFYNALSAYVNAKALELDENYEASQVMLQQSKDSIAMEMQRDKMDPTDYYPTVTYEDAWG